MHGCVLTSVNSGGSGETDVAKIWHVMFGRRRSVLLILICNYKKIDDQLDELKIISIRN